MDNQKQVIIVTRVMGKVGEATRDIQTLVSTARIISANRDESDEFTWFHYETESSESGSRGAHQNWKVRETPVGLQALANQQELTIPGAGEGVI